MRITFFIAAVGIGSLAGQSLRLADSLAERGYCRQAAQLYRQAWGEGAFVQDSASGVRVARWCRCAMTLADSARVETLLKVLEDRGTLWSIEAANLRGEWLYLRHKQDSALTIWMRTEQAAQKSGLAAHPFAATTLANLGTAYMERGQLGLADSLIHRAFRLRAYSVGPLHPDYGESLYQLASLAYSQGHQARAESLLALTTQWYLTHQTSASLGYLRCRNNLAVLRLDQGETGAAETLFVEVWRIDSSAALFPIEDKAALAHSLGQLYTEKRDFARARFYLEQAIAILRSRGTGATSPVYLQTLNNLAYLHAQEGRVDEAEFLYRQAQAGWEALGQTQAQPYLYVLGNLAVLADEGGRPQEAERLYHLVRIGWQRIGGLSHPIYLQQTLNLAVFYEENGRSKDAEELLQEFGQRWEVEGHSRLAAPYLNYLNSLAIQVRRRGDTLQVDSLYRMLFERINMPEYPLSPQAFTWVRNYANGLIDRRRFQEADSLLQWISQRAAARYPREVLWARTFQAKNLAAQGQLESALRLYEEVYRGWVEQYPTHVLRFRAAFSRACAAWEVGQSEKAFQYAVEAFDTLLAFVERVSFGLSEKSRMGRAMDLRDLAALLLGIALQKGDPQWIAQAMDRYVAQYGLLFRTAERYRALAERHPDPAVGELYRYWRGLQRQIAQQVSKGVPERDLAPLRARADSAEGALGTLLQVAITPSSYPRSRDLQAGLSRTEAILFVVAVPDTIRATAVKSYRYWAVWLTARSGWQAIPLSTREQAQAAYMQYVDRLYAQAPDRESYFVFWSRIDSVLPRRLRRLYFVPSGIYHVLAIEGLSPDGKDYVGDRYEIRRKLRIGSPSLPAGARGRTALLLGDPAFGGQVNPTQEIPAGYRRTFLSGWAIPSLPGSREEVQSIGERLQQQGVFEEVRVYTGETAVEQVLKQGQSIGYLHCATHGLFLGETYERDPLLNSGLLLTGCGDVHPPEQEEDGILTGMEVLGLDLRSCETVVLSACESGLGKVVVGEGVYGLSRAFLEAGAQRVMVTLWRVDDAATLQLMRYATAQGVPTFSSLREAQKKLRRSQWSHPYYWAGFVWQE